MKLSLPVEVFIKLKAKADKQGVSVITYIKNLLKAHSETL